MNQYVRYNSEPFENRSPPAGWFKVHVPKVIGFKRNGGYVAIDNMATKRWAVIIDFSLEANFYFESIEDSVLFKLKWADI